jgi:hypothetical protein
MIHLRRYFAGLKIEEKKMKTKSDLKDLGFPDWLTRLSRSWQMTMRDDTKHKDLLTAAAPSMLAALEACVAYFFDEAPFPTREEARIAAEIAIAHATGGRLVALRATPTTITKHHANGRVTIEKLRD